MAMQAPRSRVKLWKSASTAGTPSTEVSLVFAACSQRFMCVGSEEKLTKERTALGMLARSRAVVAAVSLRKSFSTGLLRSLQEA